MCYDLSYKINPELLFEHFPQLVVDGIIHWDDESAVHRQAHIYQPQPVIIWEDGLYKLKLFEWGLIASYMNTPELVKKNRSWMCNARSEKLLDKKAYWYRIKNQRCLIPVSGVYEHQTVTGIRNKVPYFIQMRHRAVFYLPGLYNYAPTPDPETGELKGTFTILTRSANELMQKIHNHGPNKHRMPLFLSAELEKKWLSDDLTVSEMEKILQYEEPSENLEAWPVFTLRTSKSRPDGLLANAPFDWPGLPDSERP